MGAPFERVYAVTEYWDGPREGIADYRGVPHVFRSIFRAGGADWDAGRYYLAPITPAEAALGMKAWAIWQRFADYYRGQKAPVPADPADWGALPEDLSEHRELRKRLIPVFTLDISRCVVARGEFRSLEALPRVGPVVPRLEVRWTEAASQPDDRLVPSPMAF